MGRARVRAVVRGAWGAWAASAAGVIIAGPALAGPEWPEDGDAGPLPVSAQVVGTGIGPVTKITGELEGPPGLPDRGAPGGGDFQDMYLINIVAPGKFFASTVAADGGLAEFESHLWLFHADGTGLLGIVNAENDPTGVRVNGEATDGTGAAVVEAGLYYLAISSVASVPLSGGGPIFNFADPFEISGPDGPGGADAIVGWSGATQFGLYEIVLGGVALVEPECPADLTDDGVLDFFDVQAFLGAFSAQDFAGDWNRDGVFDFFDVQEYLNDFSAGCP